MVVKLSKGKMPGPIRALIYGDPGIGKTTFCAGAENVTILDLEGGSRHLDVARIEVETFDDVLQIVREGHRSGTLAIDSFSSLEEMIVEKITEKKPGVTLTNFGGGYGHGYNLAVQYIRELVAACDRSPANTIIVGHAVQKPYTDPTGIAYDRWTIAGNEKMVQSLVKNIDYVLFAQFETATRKAGKKDVGILGERVLRTDANAAYLAKHRGELPDTIPLDWATFDDARRLSYESNIAAQADVQVDDPGLNKFRLEIMNLIDLVDDVPTRERMRRALKICDHDRTKLDALKARVNTYLGLSNTNTQETE